MKAKANYMTPEQFESLIDYVPELRIRKWPDVDVQMLYKMLYWIGLRPMEGIERKKEDIDIHNREIYLGRTKTNLEDYRVIPQLFCTDLSDWLHRKKPGELFPKLQYTTFYHWLKRSGRALDIDCFTVPQSASGEKTVGHGFRKSIGKEMHAGTYSHKPADLNIIAAQLGHNDIMSTMKYLKLDKEASKDYW